MEMLKMYDPISDKEFEFEDLNFYQVYQLLYLSKCLLRYLTFVYPDELLEPSLSACNYISAFMTFIDNKEFSKQLIDDEESSLL